MVARLRRERPIPVARVRRTRIVASSEVEVTLRVRAEVTGGRVSPEEFAVWLEDAIARYHLWRHGWVGIDCVGQVKTPEVSEWQDEQ